MYAYVRPSPRLDRALSALSLHFCRGQTFDITGEAGSIYSLISDSSLALNARFATAYTTGLFIDRESGEVSQMHPQGTWMSDIGVVVDGTTIQVSAAPLSTVSEGCSIKPQDCLKHGSVVVNGDAAGVEFVGRVNVGNGVTMQLTNKNASSTVAIESKNVNLQVDIVPPLKVREVLIPYVRERVAVEQSE